MQLQRKVYGISDLHLDINALPRKLSPRGESVIDPWGLNDAGLLLRQTVDKDAFLLIAGDSFQVNSLYYPNVIQDFEDICAKFYKVIVIFGNHEYYDGAIGDSEVEFRAATAHIPNVVLLDNEVFEGDGLRVIGSVLWTDMRKGDDVVKFACMQGMNDYNYIKIHDHGVGPLRLLHVNDTIMMYEKNRAFIKKAIDAIPENDEMATVVMTHHAPCVSHANPYGNPSALDYAYAATTFEDIIVENEIKVAVFFHGHTHDHKVTEIGSTIVATAARGYADKDFSPMFLLGPAEE